MRPWLALAAVLVVGCHCHPHPHVPPQQPAMVHATTAVHAPPAAMEDRVAVVTPDDKRYARWEGIGHKNDCTADANCQISGCESEICASENLASACVKMTATEELRTAACGCVSGQCIWYRTKPHLSVALPQINLGALQGQPCPDGKCATGLECLSYGPPKAGVATVSTCEIPCAAETSRCAINQTCVEIEGPGKVCRPSQ